MAELNGGSGGDATLNMKSFTKSLKDLSGGDDSIFAIIDDRSDVWLQDLRNPITGEMEKQESLNLVKIPPYFYWERMSEMRGYFKDLTQVSQNYDLDLCLLTYLSFLNRVHDNFYKAYDKDPSTADIKTAI